MKLTMRFLRPLLAPLLACLIIGGAIWWLQQPSTPEEASLRSLHRLMNRMETTPLAGAKPEDDFQTDFDLFSDMSNGSRPVDQAFFAKYQFEEMADRLFRTVKSKRGARIQDLDSSQTRNIIRIYLARGNQLCQAGKAKEGGEWFLRAMELNRKSATKDIFSCSFDNQITQVVGRYAAVWSEGERRAFMRRLQELPAPPDVRGLTTQNGNYVVTKAALKELSTTPLEDRRTKAMSICVRWGVRDPDWVAPPMALFSNLISADELDAEENALIQRLEPLTPVSIQEATKRSDEAWEILMAEQARGLQFIVEAHLSSPVELRRLLTSKVNARSDFSRFLLTFLTLSDEELGRLLEETSQGLNKKQLAELAKHPTPPDLRKKAELIFIGIFHRAYGDYEELLYSRIKMRCLELAMETAGKPTAAQVAALDGPCGSKLQLDQDEQGKPAILFKDKNGRYDKSHPILQLGPIK